MFVRALLVLSVSCLAHVMRIQEQPAHPIHAGTAEPTSVAVRPQPKVLKAHVPARHAARPPKAH